jgi:acylphosphatase
VSERSSRIEVVYRGRVQGVGFRATTRSLAHQVQVTGWVMNAPDGSVILEAQGDRDEIERLLRLIDQRMGSLIRGRATHDIPPQEGEVAFEIRH